LMKTYVPTLCYETLTAPSTCTRTATRPTRRFARLYVRHLCVCFTRLCASMVLRYRCPTGCVPPPTSSTPHVEQPTAARGRSPTLRQPLRSHIGLLAVQALRALLLLREYDSPFYLCAHPLHQHLVSKPCAALWRLGLEQLLRVLLRAQKCVSTVPLCASPAHLQPCAPLLPWCTSTPSRIIHRHLCSCVALPLCIAAPCRPHSPQVVPCYAAARANRDITMPSPCVLHVVSGARSEYH
jgi:hypothetical protein